MIHSSPFSQVGNDLRELDSRKADKHEIHTLNSRVDTLERAYRELSSDVNGLRSELQTAQETIRQISDALLTKGIL
jgi:hypothetical protein